MDKKQALAREAANRQHLEKTEADKPDYSAHPELDQKTGAHIATLPHHGGTFQREKDGSLTELVQDDKTGKWSPKPKKDDSPEARAAAMAEKPVPAVNVPAAANPADAGRTTNPPANAAVPPAPGAPAA